MSTQMQQQLNNRAYNDDFGEIMSATQAHEYAAKAGEGSGGGDVSPLTGGAPPVTLYSQSPAATPELAAQGVSAHPAPSAAQGTTASPLPGATAPAASTIVAISTTAAAPGGEPAQMSWGKKVFKFITEGTENPWVRVVIYVLACLLTSCLYFGWQAYSDMLIRGGVYEWKCNESNWGDTEGEDDPTKCQAQSSAVAGLYSLASGSEFACAAIAGILLDGTGPRLTALVGELLQAIAVMMIVHSGKGRELYVPGFLITGACVNIISFPALTVMEAWPKHQALIVSLVVGAQSAASLITPVMLKLWDSHLNWTLSGIWMIWLLVLWLPITVLYVWALPTKRNFAALVAESALKKTAADDDADASAVLADKLEAGEGAEAAAAAAAAKKPVVGGVEAIEGAPTTQKAAWKAFFWDILTIDMALMAAFCFMLMFEFGYYPAVLKSAVSAGASDFFSWLTPAQGPFSIIIGFSMDYVGTTPIMFCMCLALIWINLSSSEVPGALNYQRFIGFLFTFFQSATYNIKYSFAGEMYDPFNFGKLVGFLGICGGAAVYCTNPLTASTNYKTIFRALTAVVGVMLLVCATLHYRQYCLGKTHKTVAAVEQTNRLFKVKPQDNDDKDEKTLKSVLSTHSSAAAEDRLPAPN